jgi:hypothetical protein
MSFPQKALAVSCALMMAVTCHAAQIDIRRAVTAPPGPLVSETPATGSSMPVLSADGRYLAFISRAPNLITNRTSGSYQVFLRDLTTSNIVLVSATLANTGGNDHSTLPSLSSNGLWIAFESEASDLVADDTNGLSDIFVRDVAGGQLAASAEATAHPAIR